jgi:hypothetical protein
VTDYNDGKWHGWNGGECPVDPGAVVDIVWLNYDGSAVRDYNHWDVAADHCWVHDGDDGDIIAFRVIRPTEPAPPTDPLAALTARVERLEAILTKEASDADV